MSALIAAHGVTHAYRRRPVLRDVSLAVAAGAFVGVIGPNGSGKSTLLRCLGRALKPNAGRVTIDGRDAWSLPPRSFARRVAFVAQAPPAPPDLIVEELVWRGRYPHRGLFGRTDAGDRQAVERAMQLADVEAFAGRPLGTLSGGERQRAFIALALAQTPDVLLLDEPTTYLDVGHQLALMALLARLSAREGVAVVSVMHDVAQAGFYCGRLVALRDGALVADGTPDEVLQPERLKAIFGVALRIIADPVTGARLVLPGGAPGPGPEPTPPPR
jgi:iron complex transport system ATP-binding protein